MNLNTPCRLAALPLALSMALALGACGGSNSDSAAETPFKAGEVMTFTATLEDGSSSETRFLVHGVTAQGDLLTDSAPADAKNAAPGKVPLEGVLVALPLHGNEQDNAAWMGVLRDFYKQLWQGIAQRRGDTLDIAAEIGGFENDVGALYSDYLQSQFASVQDYVDFYEQVGENRYFDAQGSVEEELVQFFYLTGWHQGAWLQALQGQSFSWPRFLQLMAERQDTFAALLGQYQSWSQAGGTGMQAFIARYVGSAAAVPGSAEGQGIAPRDLRKAAAAKGQGSEKFFATNTSWNVRVNSLEQASAAVLSSQDTNISNYRRTGQKKDVCPTKLTISGRLGVAQAQLDWKMQYNEEKHPSLPGTFISSFGMEYLYAAGGERLIIIRDRETNVPSPASVGKLMSPLLIKGLGVNLEIKDLYNAGTDAAPRPGFTAQVKVTPKKIFNSPWVRDCPVS